MTSLNNRCQLNDSDLRPNSFCQARSKNISWKLQTYCGYLRENNVICVIYKRCSRCEFKINFQNVYSPCTNMRPQWNTFWRRLCPGLQTQWGIRGSYPQIYFLPPQFCCALNYLFQTFDKNKNLSP